MAQAAAWLQRQRRDGRSDAARLLGGMGKRGRRKKGAGRWAAAGREEPSKPAREKEKERMKREMGLLEFGPNRFFGIFVFF